jgi:peptide/nickel transport system permease protein
MTQNDKVAQLDADESEVLVSRSLWDKAITRMRKDRLTLISGGVILLISLLALGADFISYNILPNVDFTKTVIRDAFVPMLSYGYGPHQELDRNDKITLDEMTVAEGLTTITLDITIPEGFSYNNKRATQGSVEIAEDANEDVVTDRERDLIVKLDRISSDQLELGNYQVEIPMNVVEGQTTILVEFKASYCEIERTNVCFNNDVTYTIPLTVTADSDNTTMAFSSTGHIPEKTHFYILGADDLGRDQLSRLLYAGRISLKIGFLAGLLSIVIGISLGIVTGYFGGIVDDIIIWLVTTINSIPYFFTILIVSAILSPDENSLILVLGFLGWTGTTRLIRGETISLREREYIISARAMGASNFRVMFNHILPNLISVIVINLAIDIGVLILVEAALSFLAVGVQPPTPTWGNMLTNSQQFFRNGPHLVFWPGFMIFITVLCLYVVGDGIRDAFDPTLND